MPRRSPEDPKTAALRTAGALHRRPQSVRDEAFGGEQEFFDPRDRVQVRYEMLRRHRVEGRPVSTVAAAFGVSRQAFYMTDRVFEKQGIPGLLPRPLGLTIHPRSLDRALARRKKKLRTTARRPA